MKAEAGACHNCGFAGGQLLFQGPAFDAVPAAAGACFPVSRCPACGLVNTGLAAAETVADSYDLDYYGSTESKFADGMEALLDGLARRRAASLLDTWQRAPGAMPTVLDIGCGRAVLLRAFRGLGAEVTGLERDEFPLQGELAEIVQHAGLDDPRFDGRQWDIVVLWHVFEHLEGQDAMLELIDAHLAPGGVLALAVPNFGSLQSRLFGRHWFHLDLPRHLVHIDAPWLRTRLAQHGLRIEREGHLDLAQNLYGFVQSAMNALFPGQPNRFYALLKHGGRRGAGAWLELGGWSLLAGLLMPFAILESLAGLVTHSGATVAFYARKAGQERMESSA